MAERCGTPYLAKICNQLLSKHIFSVLPHLKNEIREKIKEKKEELHVSLYKYFFNKIYYNFSLMEILLVKINQVK